MTNGTPALDGSPSRTAICAPDGSVAGAGPHLMSDGAIATCLAMAGLSAGAAFFAVCVCTLAGAIEIAQMKTRSVVRTVDIDVSCLRRNVGRGRIIREKFISTLLSPEFEAVSWHEHSVVS